MGGDVKIDGSKVGVAATVVKGEEGVIWVTGSCIGVVPFTRGVAEICVCSWTGFVPSGIESSFRLYVKSLFCSCMYCRALSYSPMSVRSSSLSILFCRRCISGITGRVINSPGHRHFCLYGFLQYDWSRQNQNKEIWPRGTGATYTLCTEMSTTAI